MTPQATPAALLAAALRGDAAPWPAEVTASFEADLLDAASTEGVTELLSVAPALQRWPHSVESAVLQRRREAAAIEIIRQNELANLLSAMQQEGIKPLVLKGSGLAYTHYQQPWMRSRLDMDLLVASGDRAPASDVLGSLGYQPSTHFDGELVTYQAQLRRVDGHEMTHRVDLHWKIANPQVFSNAFAFTELDRAAVPIPQLGSSARTLSSPHALVLACLHRVAHHQNSNRLIWLYDIRLLLDAMSQGELEHAVEIARSKNLQAVVAAGVSRARHLVGSNAQRPGIERLFQGPVGSERTADEFLRTDRTKFDDLRSDMRALQGWRPKIRLIREHLFPPAAYMRHAYGVSNPVLLPLAYAVRAASGASRWFRPPR